LANAQNNRKDIFVERLFDIRVNRRRDNLQAGLCDREQTVVEAFLVVVLEGNALDHRGLWGKLNVDRSLRAAQADMHHDGAKPSEAAWTPLLDHVGDLLLEDALVTKRLNVKESDQRVDIGWLKRNK
jgi:hypothetical protein